MRPSPNIFVVFDERKEKTLIKKIIHFTCH
jgi:hypothetical protein